MMVFIYVMQVSIVVPLLVAWRRWPQLPAEVRLLSVYCVLSAICSLGGQTWNHWLANNYGFIVGFNIGKTVLLALVYYRVLTNRLLRRLVPATTVAMLLLVAAIGSYNMDRAVDISRILQCALLSGYALVYLEQELHQPRIPAAHNPIWLLSVGQLMYSAITISAFSLDYLSRTAEDQTYKYIFIALGGIVFNVFLTLAVARAQRASGPVAIPASQLSAG